MAANLENVASGRQVTRGPGGRILTNAAVWSPDGKWIVYDTRSDAAGDVFDGTRIEQVNVETGEVRVLYTSARGACCGVATFHPRLHRVIFILGPEHPTPEWAYGPARRQGVIVDAAHPGAATPMDACNLVPPFTRGALRGGSHVHVWDGAGEWISFTYEDHPLSRFADPGPDHDINQRNVGVSIPSEGVHVPQTHPRNHDGTHFTVLATRTTAVPRPGSDEIKRAFEESWIGRDGYIAADGVRRRHSLAFQGHIVTKDGETISEVFILDLPDDLSRPGDGPLEGTENRMPYPPQGTVQRRLTRTEHRKHPGIQGPRHWLRSSPDGSQIAFLMKDDEGVAQLWTVSPHGGPARQVTRNSTGIASAFTWSPDGRRIAHLMDGSVCVTEVAEGITRRLTVAVADASAPRPEACVFSPDGCQVAYVRRIAVFGGSWNQIFVVPVKGGG